MSTRRTFFRDVGRVVVLVPAGVGLVRFLAACTSECSNADAVELTASDLTVTSGCASNHTHDFTVATADLASPPAAGVSGESTAYEDGHTHAVALTAAELSQIESGATVEKVSGVAGGHTHTFRFRKA